MKPRMILQLGALTVIGFIPASPAEAEVIPQVLPTPLYESLVQTYLPPTSDTTMTDQVGETATTPQARDVEAFQRAGTVDSAFSVIKPNRSPAEDRVARVAKGYLFLIASAVQDSGRKDLKSTHPATVLSKFFTAEDREIARSLTPSALANGAHLTPAQAKLRAKIQDLRDRRRFDTLDNYSAKVSIPQFGGVWETIRTCYEFAYSADSDAKQNSATSRKTTGQELTPVFRVICRMNEDDLNCDSRKGEKEPERLKNKRTLRFPKSLSFREARPNMLSVEATLKPECQK